MPKYKNKFVQRIVEQKCPEILDVKLLHWQQSLHFLPAGKITCCDTHPIVKLAVLDLKTDADCELILRVQCVPYLSQTPAICINWASSKKTGQGNLRPAFRSIVEWAQFLGIEQIVLSAIKTGRYAWLRYGFVPTYSAWVGICRSLSVAIDCEPAISNTLRAKMKKLINPRFPENANRFANLPDKITIAPKGVPMRVKASKHLLTNMSTQSYPALFDLNSPKSMARMRRYCSRCD